MQLPKLLILSNVFLSFFLTYFLGYDIQRTTKICPLLTTDLGAFTRLIIQETTITTKVQEKKRAATIIVTSLKTS